MDKPADLHQRVRRETARSRRAVRASVEIRARVQATLAQSRALHARLVSERLLDKYRT